MSANQVSFYNQMLNTNLCEAVVQGPAGDVTLICTLLDTLIPPGKKVKPASTTNQLPVWVVDAQYWNVIDLSRLKSFRLLSSAMDSVTDVAKSKPATSVYALVRAGNNPSKIDVNVLNTYAPTTPDQHKQLILSELRAGVCEIKFTKADNTVRIMKATLDPDQIEGFGLTPSNPSVPPVDNDTLKVVDVEAQGWRTVKLSKILSFKVSAPAPTTNKQAVNAERQAYLTSLSAGPCEVVFTKGDGTKRTMLATLNQAKLAELGLTIVGANENHTASPDVISVVDLDISKWRSFNIRRVLAFKSLSATPVKRRTTLTAVN